MPPPISGITTGDVVDISKRSKVPAWLRTGLAAIGATPAAASDSYNLRGLGQLGRSVYDTVRKKPEAKAFGEIQGQSAAAAQAVEANRPYDLGMGFMEYSGVGGPADEDDPSKRKIGGGPSLPRGGPPAPGTAPVAPPERVTPGQEHLPPPTSPPPPPATPPNMGTGYGRRDTSKGPREQVDSVFTPVTDPTGGPIVVPDAQPVPGRQPSGARGPQEQVDSRVRSYWPEAGPNDPPEEDPPPPPPIPQPPNISTGYGDGTNPNPQPGQPPLPPPPDMGTYWGPQYEDGGNQAGRVPGQWGDGSGGNNGVQYNWGLNDWGGGGYLGSNGGPNIYGSYGYRKGGRIFGEVIANLGEDLGKEESVDEFEDVVPSSKAPEYARLTLENGVAPDPAEIPEQPANARGIRPPALAAPGVLPPAATPASPVASSGMADGPPPPTSPPMSAPPPATMAPVIAQAPRQRIELPPEPTKPKPPSTLRRVIAGVVGGVTNNREVGHEILYPGRAAQVAQYKHDTQRAKDQVALETQQENTASLSEQRESNAAYRRTLDQDVRDRAQDRDDARTATAKTAEAAQKQRQYGVWVKGREDSVVPLREGETAPAGWEVINHPDGGQVAIPPATAKVPKELVEFIPGSKEGDLASRGDYRKAEDAYQKRAGLVEKPAAQNRAHWIATMNDPAATPAARQAAKANLDEEDRRTKANRPPSSGGGMFGSGGGAADDPKVIAQEIINGRQSPELTGLYGKGAAVRAELGRNKYNHATALTDWRAVQRHMSTLNGPQQERLRQAVTFTYDSLDQIEGLYEEWKKVAGVSGIKILNRGNLAISKQLGGKSGEIATNLEAQINDLTSELGTVYKGGNSSTDESLRLAGENLKADWNDATFKRAVGQIRQNLQIRRNSINNSQPQGVSANSPYVGGGGQQQSEMITVTTPDGKTGQIHPSQWDNFLKVNPGAKRQ